MRLQITTNKIPLSNTFPMTMRPGMACIVYHQTLPMMSSSTTASSSQVSSRSMTDICIVLSLRSGLTIAHSLQIKVFFVERYCLFRLIFFNIQVNIIITNYGTLDTQIAIGCTTLHTITQKVSDLYCRNMAVQHGNAMSHCQIAPPCFYPL